MVVEVVLVLVVVVPGSRVGGVDDGDVVVVVVAPPGVVVVVVGRIDTAGCVLPGALDAAAAVMPTAPTKNTAIPVTTAARLVEREDKFNLLGFDGERRTPAGAGPSRGKLRGEGHRCKPHSVFSSPDHRPERTSAPSSTGWVHGRHPIDG